MRSFLNGKHYKGEKIYSLEVVDKTVSIRLSDSEMDIIKREFPNDTVSYAIRSIIHEFDRLKSV